MDSNAIIPAIAALVGIVVGAVLSEWRTTRAEGRMVKRARAAAIADWERKRLTDTRRGIERLVAQLEASTLGDVETAERHGRAIEDLDLDLMLVGDAAAVRGFRGLAIELRARFGKGLPPDYIVRRATVVNDLLSALDEQERRLLDGKPLERISREMAPELYEAEPFATQMQLPWRLPSPQAILARAGLDLLRWLERQLPSGRRHGR
jgi:hypothetical protein